MPALELKSRTAIAVKTLITALIADIWVVEIVDEMRDEVNALDQLPSKRAVNIKYRGLVVPGVNVKCLAHHVELQVYAR